MLEYVLWIFAWFGVFCTSQIIWMETETHRHKLKLKLFPKWKAKFKVGDYVAYKNNDGEDMLCKVTGVFVEKNKDSGEVEVEYAIRPLYRFNPGFDMYWYDACLFSESDLEALS